MLLGCPLNRDRTELSHSLVLVRLAEEAARPAVLRALAFMVSHGRQSSLSDRARQRAPGPQIQIRPLPGAAIAQRLLDAGAKVVVTGRSRGEATPAGATFIAGDVSSAEGVKAIAAKAVAALGGLDILVNNAGGARPIAVGSASIPEEEWQASFALNLFAAVRLTNAVLPALRESKVGAIVNISSNAARMPFGPFAHYCAAKAALDMYSRALA
ncbi:MAG: SDR family NAD(P)-dependent oxidoreductase, partial [Polyangiaceae bacterium]